MIRSPALPALVAVLAFAVVGPPAAAAPAKRPNILHILADDLGYGDVSALNPARGNIPAPHLDRLAAQGLTFTDAHRGSSVCPPTRYGLLTGRYAWRTRLQQGLPDAQLYRLRNDPGETGNLVATHRAEAARLLSQLRHYVARGRSTPGPAAANAVPVTLPVPASIASRPRLAIFTDIGGDPDDEQALVRLLHYANEFDLELLVATAIRSRHVPAGPETRPQLIRRLVDAYGEVLPNFRRHASGWPAADELRARIVSGNPRYGRAFVGADHDTAASRALIARIDAGTAENPLNLAFWGGQTDLAQALWRVRADRGAAGLAAFVRLFRVYDVSDQDALADWLHAEFPGLFYLIARAVPGRAKEEATFRGMYLTGDESLTSRAWIEENVRSRGPLGALYPIKTYTAPNPHGVMKEGDAPSWFFFLPLGGNDPRDPTRPGWGGQYRRLPDGRWGDLPAADGFEPRHTVSRWRPDFQRDFARRAAWALPATPAAPNE